MAATNHTKDNPRKELFSVAYMTALAAKADCDIAQPSRDRTGYDAIIETRVPSAPVIKNPAIFLQYKATSKADLTKTSVALAVPAAQYNSYVVSRNAPFVLIAFVIPDDFDASIVVNANDLLMRCRAFWVRMDGKSPTSNKSSQTIHIPTANRLDAAKLKDMLLNVSEDKELHDVR